MEYNDNANMNNNNETAPVNADEILNAGADVSRGNGAWQEPIYRAAAPDQRQYYSPNYSAAVNAAPSVQTRPVKKPKEKKEHRFLRAVCLILVCVLLCSAASAGCAYYVTRSQLQNAPTQAPVTRQVVLGSQASDAEASSSTGSGSTGSKIRSNMSNGLEASAGEVYELAKKQVVGVSLLNTTTNFFGQSSSQFSVSGTGFVISEDGYIMTNYHVIEYAVAYDSSVQVFFFDETTYDATIVGYDADNDVAILKINATGLTPIDIAYDFTVGDTVYAVGNPLGELTFTMTSGIISATDRTISTSSYTTLNMFQIDAAVNSGNSGGAVYNAYGQVIGMVTAKYASSSIEGLGFAIPMGDAFSVAEQLIENGYVSGKAYLGVVLQDITSYVMQYYGWPQGVYVYSVTDGSAAQKAGIMAGDIITKIGDTDVTSFSQAKSLIRTFKAGDSSTLTIYRNGQTMTVDVTFDENVPETASASSRSSQAAPFGGDQS